MRRLVTVFVVALLTATGSLWWLHDGAIVQAVEPVLPEWDADQLAEASGLFHLPEQAIEAPSTE